MSEAEYYYLDAKIAVRAQLLSEEQALEGATLISLETTDAGNDRLQDFIEADPAAFYRYLRRLRRPDQDILLGYWFLEINQAQLGAVTGLTQTTVSHRLRIAGRAICAMIAHGIDGPDKKTMRRIFEAAGIESVNLLVTQAVQRRKACLLSDLFFDFQQTRSFGEVAKLHGAFRPDIRRLFVSVIRKLAESEKYDEQVIAAWLFYISEKAPPSCSGIRARDIKKQAPQLISLPDCVGSFRVRTSDQGFGQLFSSKANQ